MSGSEPTGLDAMWVKLNYWLAEEIICRLAMVDATNRYHEARDNAMRLKAEIVAAEAAEQQRIVIEDDGETT